MQTPTSFRRALAAGRDFRRGSTLLDRRRRAADAAFVASVRPQAPAESRVILRRAA
jgi:hypothetical protein